MDKNQPTLVLVSAMQEWHPIIEFYRPAVIGESPYGPFFTHRIQDNNVVFAVGGWGKISSAASAQYMIDRWHPSLVINLGTCGGFDGAVDKGDIILVNETFVYDMVEQMSDQSVAIDFYHTRLDLSFLTLPYPQPVKSACMVSGDRDLVPADIPRLKQQFNAIAGDWESASIAWVAKKNNLHCLILRGVSDVVSPEGSEAYGNLDAFVQGARIVMTSLLDHLPQWLAKQEQGFST